MKLPQISMTKGLVTNCPKGESISKSLFIKGSLIFMLSLRQNFAKTGFKMVDACMGLKYFTFFS